MTFFFYLYSTKKRKRQQEQQQTQQQQPFDEGPIEVLSDPLWYYHNDNNSYYNNNNRLPIIGTETVTSSSSALLQNLRMLWSQQTTNGVVVAPSTTNRIQQQQQLQRYQRTRSRPVRFERMIIVILFVASLLLRNTNAKLFNHHHRPTVKILILAGEGNIEGFGSVHHLQDLIEKEQRDYQRYQENNQALMNLNQVFHTTSSSSSSSYTNSGHDSLTATVTDDDEVEESTSSIDNDDMNRNHAPSMIYSNYVDTFDNETGKVLNWTVVDNVYVTYEHYRGKGSMIDNTQYNATAAAAAKDILSYSKLTLNSTMAGCSHCFGPEFPIGYLLHEIQVNDGGDDNDIPLIIIKAGWHDRSLSKDWLNGYQWYRFINTIEQTIHQLPIILHDNKYYKRYSKKYWKHPRIVYTGMVWWQGYSDMINGKYRDEYIDNLYKFFIKIRTTLQQNDLPIAIVEMGISGTNNRYIQRIEYELRQQQYAVASEIPLVQIVSTAHLVDQYQLLQHHTTTSSASSAIDGTTTTSSSPSYHPRNETQYYYGRADVLFEITQNIVITLIELHEQRIQQNQYHWFGFRGSLSGTSSSATSITGNEDETMNEYEEFQQKTYITNTFGVGVMFLFFTMIIYIMIQQVMGNRNINDFDNNNNNNSNMNGIRNKPSSFANLAKIFRPTLSTINEEEDDDNCNSETTTNIFLITKLSDEELQERASKYGVQAQY